MGYKRKRKTVTLTFGEDHELHGLEVVVKGLPLGEYFSLTDQGKSTSIGIIESLEFLAENLVSWNLEEEDGSPVPATREAVMAEDHDMMLLIVARWFDTLNGKVPDEDPLSESSPDGGQSLEESIPMDALSGSLAS